MPFPRKNRFPDKELSAKERAKKVTKVAARGRRRSPSFTVGTSTSGTVPGSGGGTTLSPATSASPRQSGSFLDRVRRSIANGLRRAASNRRNN